MKKFLVLAALAGVLVASVASVSEAVVLRTKQVGWLDSRSTVAGGIGAHLKFRTTMTAANTTPLDTTGYFSLSGLSLPQTGGLDAANTDSVAIAYLHIACDTTAAVSNDLTVISYTIDASDDGLNWTPAVSVVTNSVVTSGDGQFNIPLWIKVAEGNGTTAVKNVPLLAKMLRVRFAASTGTLYSANCHMYYWAEE